MVCIYGFKFFIDKNNRKIEVFALNLYIMWKSDSRTERIDWIS